MGQEEEPGPTVAEEGVQPRGLLAGVAVEEEEVGETDKQCKECQDGLGVLPMPMKYILEMVCDWKGAGKAQGHGHPGELQEWYNKNKEKMSLHPNTRAEVENLIEWI